jgi:formate dehydrogenase
MLLLRKKYKYWRQVQSALMLSTSAYQFKQVSGSNVVSVAEHVVMSILLLVRNFVPAHEVCAYVFLSCTAANLDLQMIERGDWQVSDIARNAFDLENKVIGTIGAGRIGYRVLQRLVAFDCKELLYFDYAPLPDGIYNDSSC